MLDEARSRTAVFQAQLADAGIELALLTDPSSIAYLAGFWGYLGVEFGRPTVLVVPESGSPTVVTPLMESEMVGAMTWVQDVRTWEDFGVNSWQTVLGEVLDRYAPGTLYVERLALPALLRAWLDDTRPRLALGDVSPVLTRQRMIKSPLEIDIMRSAGRIGGAMMRAAEESLAAGRPEYESALAVIDAGTRAAAGFLTDRGWEAYVSPVIHDLQIMQSGRSTSMVHRRASVRCVEAGDPVYFCFCNLLEFKHYRLGFDRMFFVGRLSDEQARVQQAAIDAQQAAVDAIRPGVRAEDIAEAANEVYRARGYATGYRTGRAIGMAQLEAPELKAGDRTLLEPGMTFAVDGGISVEGSSGGRIGDSVVVTAEGCEFLTDYPRDIRVV